MSLLADREIAAAMPRAWDAFFARFGRLTEVQRVAIPFLLRGEDAVISSATASGKTEAVCAPLLDRNLAKVHREWMVLYISPTRALVNDLYARLEGPATELNLRVARRTGEYHETFKTSPNLLITTPESVDSVLCRGAASEGVHPFAHVVAVVLDEVHLLYGTPRGEQVRCLLERLRRLRAYGKKRGWTRADSLQVAALSATVPDFEKIRSAYAPAGAAIRVPGGRMIKRLHNAELALAEHSVERLLSSESAALKILIFCNSRKRVDELSVDLQTRLSRFGYRVCAHHGSLSKIVREDTENILRASDRVVVVATSTLEIGIDIGNVDVVVLDAPAHDIPALLQRIGRGNRRTEFTTVLACGSGSFAALTHEAMLASAEEGWLGEGQTGMEYAVTLQQIASYIYQSPRRDRSRAQLSAFLNGIHPDGAGVVILNHMVANGELIENEAGIRLGPGLVEECERGSIHSTIEDLPGTRVVDQQTGVEYAKNVSFGGGRGLHLGGMQLEVRSATHRTIEVLQGKTAENGRWTYANRPFFLGGGQPQAVKHYLGYAPDEWPFVRVPRGVLVFHFGGSRRHAVIDLIRGVAGSNGSDEVDEWGIVFRAEPPGAQLPTWLAAPNIHLLELSLGENLDRLERHLARPRANARLPHATRVREVASWLDLQGECARFAAARLVPMRSAHADALSDL